jgi:hypothetical protein
MNDRRPSDAQITAALRAHLPAQAQAGPPPNGADLEGRPRSNAIVPAAGEATDVRVSRG